MSRRLCNTSTPGEGFDLAVETELQNLESRPLSPRPLLSQFFEIQRIPRQETMRLARHLPNVGLGT